jgi:uncharacterized membrane protein YeaQ/YmgE (transglycosylase-associated protein family)
LKERLMLTLGDWLGITGLVLALPLGIVGTLLTPVLQQRWSKRSQRARDRQTAAKASEVALIRGFAANRDELHEYLLSLVLRVAWITAVFGALSGVLFSLQFALLGLERFAALAGQLVAIIGAFVVVQIAGQGLRVIRLVRQADAGRV